jgi:hypothetical protein
MLTPSAPIADAEQKLRQSECGTDKDDAACPDGEQQNETGEKTDPVLGA